MRRVFLSIGLLIIYQSGFSQIMNEILALPTDNSITVSVLFDTNAEVYFEYGTSKGIYPFTTQVFASGI
jgi:hypothetical protein